VTNDTDARTSPLEGDMSRPDPDEVDPVKALDLLVDEARSTIIAQVDLAKAVAAAAGSTLRNVAILVSTALLLTLVALLTLAVGTMLSLSPRLGMPIATLMVGGVLLLSAAIAVLVARRAITRFRTALAGKPPS
jgi:uncharacterized membrane protein